MTRREELKAEYKQNAHHLRRMGVYQVKNLANGRVYLDRSMNLEGAIARDPQWLARGMHMNAALQADLRTHGPEAFVVEALEELTPTPEPRDYADELKLLYEVWLETLQPWGERGYMPMPRR